MSSAIRTRIDLLRGRARGGELLRGTGRLAAVAVLGLTGWLAVDYWLVTTVFGSGMWDLGARFLLTATLVGMVVTEARRGLLAELKRRRDDDELALRLESAHPGLGGRLISTVQLMRDVEAGELGKVCSPGLVEALAEDTEARAQGIDHRPAWDLRPARRAALWGVALLVIGLALAAWRADITAAFLRRLAFLSAHYPTDTHILAVHVPALVGRGDPVLIEIEVDPAGNVPERATATVRGADGRSATLRLERVESAGRAVYRGSLKQAVEDIAVRPHAGDHRWEHWEPVRVVPRPAVKSLALRLALPAYLEQPPQETSAGDLEVPEGTVVEISAALSRTVTDAAVLISDGLDEPVRLPLTLDAAGATATGSFTVTVNGSWSIWLRSADGLDSGTPARWSITAIPDRAPTVAITFPPRDKEATRFARWPIRFTARDDHGVAGAALRWVVVPLGGDIDAITGEPGRLDAQGVRTTGSEAVQGEVVFDLTLLNLAVGSRVVYWMEVRDARTPEANVGMSQRGSFAIFDPEELRDRMAREKAELLNTIKTIRDRQRDAREGVEGARKAAEQQKP